MGGKNIMKLVYYDRNFGKLFEIKVSKLEVINEEDLIDDVKKINDDYKKLFKRLKEEVFIFKALDDGEDFYLKYFNHINYFEQDDNYFRIGSRLSQTIARNDKAKNLINMLRDIYNGGDERQGIVKYLTNKGKLFKSLDFRYFKMCDQIICIHEDKTEVRMYRESTLNEKDLGVAIYQNKRFVEVNERYASIVSKSREQLLGAAQDLRGVPKEIAKTILEQVTAIENQEKRSYKTPMVSFDENGDIRYYINAEGSYIIYDNMPAVLFKIKDLTQQERSKRLNATNADKKIRLQSTLNELGHYSKTFISYAIYPDKFSVSENFYDVIEDDNHDFVFRKDTLREFVMSEDLELYDSMIASLSPTNPEVEFTTSIMTLKLNIKYIRHYFKRIYDSEGNAKSYVSAHQDITEEASYSNSLKKQIYDKNEIIKDKDIQIKEAHHSIKNNLNILLSLIHLEEHYNKDSEDIVEETKSHLKAISVMHENLYKSKNLESLELKSYVDSIVKALFEIYSSDISYVSHVDDISLNADQGSSLGLIINELINNTVKYAFPDENDNATVEIKISRIDKLIEVEYRDSGVGIPDDISFDNPSTLGLIIIQNLTKQLDGKIEYSYDNGACFKLVFKERNPVKLV